MSAGDVIAELLETIHRLEDSMGAATRAASAASEAYDLAASALYGVDAANLLGRINEVKETLSDAVDKFGPAKEAVQDAVDRMSQVTGGF